MNKKILIVREDQQDSKALSFLLSGSGYQVTIQSNAGQAVEVAKHQSFDLAITDESLPENQPDLGLVSSLKQAHPKLPILFLVEEKTMESVIGCIRAGVTEVIEGPSDFKKIIESVNSSLRAESSEDDITWDDIVEIEGLLGLSSPTEGGESSGSGGADPAELEKLKKKLQETLDERDKVSGELSQALTSLEKTSATFKELESNGLSGELLERIRNLDSEEEALSERADKLAADRLGLESQIAELKTQREQFDQTVEEAAKEAGVATEEVEAIKSEFEEKLAQANAERLEAQARIQDLETSLEKAVSEVSAEQQEAMDKLNEELLEAKELLSEKDFIIQQRDRELAEAIEKADSQEKANALEIEEQKRLLEIEKSKFQEKIEQFEIERRLAEDTHEKNQREIQVERRDAEISLRELQTKIKEEQLQQKVAEANFKEEVRLFEQARNNFQEDIQELQAKQAELRKMEAYLQKMEEAAESGQRENTLPKPDSGALDPLETKTQTAPNAKIEGEPQADAEGPAGSGEAKDPNAWKKPNFEKKAGRGPLRIGRRSAF